MTRDQPIVGISMGAPAGIGPEIIVKALARDIVRDLCRPIVIGDAAIIRNATRIMRSDLQVISVSNVAEASFEPTMIDVYDLKNVDASRLELGKVSAMA